MDGKDFSPEPLAMADSLGGHRSTVPTKALYRLPKRPPEEISSGPEGFDRHPKRGQVSIWDLVPASRVRKLGRDGKEGKAKDQETPPRVTPNESRFPCGLKGLCHNYRPSVI